MNVTNQNQSLVKNELGHYFISLTIIGIMKFPLSRTLLMSEIVEMSPEGLEPTINADSFCLFLDIRIFY